MSLSSPVYTHLLTRHQGTLWIVNLRDSLYMILLILWY